MEYIKLKCPQCDADLEVENGIDLFYCKYCGCRLMLDGQNKHVIAAKMHQKDLEHERYKMKFAAQEKEKDYQRTKENDKNAVIGGISIFAIIVLIIIIVFALGSSSVRREERKLSKIENEVRALIEEGRYDEALTRVEQIRYENDWESEPKKKWDKTREALKKEIKSKQKTYVDDFGIAVPMSSSDAKGMNYKNVVKQFEDAGFTNIQTVKLNEKSGLFSKAGIGDVKQISIDGDKSFKAGTKFISDSSIVISYYGLE